MKTFDFYHSMATVIVAACFIAAVTDPAKADLACTAGLIISVLSALVYVFKELFSTDVTEEDY